MFEKNRFSFSGGVTIGFLMAILIVSAIIPAFVVNQIENRTATTVALNSLERNIDNRIADILQTHEAKISHATLHKSRNSVCLVYVEFWFTKDNGRGDKHQEGPTFKAYGTGFVARNGIIITNRHIAEPWIDSQIAAKFINGRVKANTKIIAFFPGVGPVDVKKEPFLSKEYDLAAMPFDDKEGKFYALPLASSPTDLGDAVATVGYPTGPALLAAEFKGSFPRDFFMLVSNAFPPPVLTFGRVGISNKTKVFYDASIAEGSSGSPLINQRGEVVAVSRGYLAGAAHESIGIPANLVKQLLDDYAREHRR